MKKQRPAYLEQIFQACLGKNSRPVSNQATGEVILSCAETARRTLVYLTKSHCSLLQYTP